jgi:hypothetical protein
MGFNMKNVSFVNELVKNAEEKKKHHIAVLRETSKQYSRLSDDEKTYDREAEHRFNIVYQENELNKVSNSLKNRVIREALTALENGDIEEAKQFLQDAYKF